MVGLALFFIGAFLMLVHLITIALKWAEKKIVDDCVKKLKEDGKDGNTKHGSDT